ncbi:MAG: hypothetical protein IJM59_07230 [Proteobacteria bacterium]|nr:hypothetical protein [Pseudomonadota bacterium]
MGLLDCSDYMIRRRMFSIGGAFDIYDMNGNQIGHCRQKAFKLKEDIRIFTDETKSTEILTIKAQQVIDFSASYDVVTTSDSKHWGVWQRKGWSSILRDSWKLHTSTGTDLVLEEDSMFMAFLRRFLTNLIPQDFQLKNGDTVVAEFKQHFNPFIFKLDVHILTPDGNNMAPLIAAAAILLSAIEGRQS